MVHGQVKLSNVTIWEKNDFHICLNKVSKKSILIIILKRRTFENSALFLYLDIT